MEPLNKDGEAVLAGFRLRDRDLDDVIEKLVDRLILSGYLKADNKNFIMISADGQEPVSLTELKHSIDEQMKLRQVDGSTVTKRINDYMYDDDFFDDDLELSAAKLDFIRQLNKYDNTLTLDSLKNMTVEDLMLLARKNNVDLDDLFDHHDLYDAFDDLDDLYDDMDDDDRNEVQVQPQPQPVAQPQPTPQPAPTPQPKPAPVYYDDDDYDDWNDDWDDDDDDWDDDWDDDDDDDDWDD